LLFYLTRKIMPLVTLETGFGYGMSACFMLSGHKINNIGSVHVSIDPHFRGWTNGVGTFTLKRLGLSDSHHLIEKPSGHVLPRLKLPKESKKLQLSFIDGNHLFDFALVDFFYIDQLTQHEGLIVFDDVSTPALTTLVNFIAANRPDYRLFWPNSRTVICQKIDEDRRSWDHYRPFEVSMGHDWG
jgi:predicted O-methyltransferase YrrM